MVPFLAAMRKKLSSSVWSSSTLKPTRYVHKQSKKKLNSLLLFVVFKNPMFTLLSIRISLSPLSLSRLSSSVLLTRTHKLVVSPLRVQFDTELRDNNSQYINDQSLQVHPLSFDFFLIFFLAPILKKRKEVWHTHTDRETCLFFIDSKIPPSCLAIVVVFFFFL